MSDAGASEFEQILRSYVGKLPARLALLEAAWQARPPDLETLHQVAHQMAGTAAMFGLAPVGQTAARVDEIALRMLGTGVPETAAMQAALHDLERTVATLAGSTA